MGGREVKQTKTTKACQKEKLSGLKTKTKKQIRNPISAAFYIYFEILFASKNSKLKLYSFITMEVFWSKNQGLFPETLEAFFLVNRPLKGFNPSTRVHWKFRVNEEIRVVTSCDQSRHSIDSAAGREKIRDSLTKKDWIRLRLLELLLGQYRRQLHHACKVRTHSPPLIIPEKLNWFLRCRTIQEPRYVSHLKQWKNDIGPMPSMKPMIGDIAKIQPQRRRRNQSINREIEIPRLRQRPKQSLLLSQKNPP